MGGTLPPPTPSPHEEQLDSSPCPCVMPLHPLRVYGAPLRGDSLRRDPFSLPLCEVASLYHTPLFHAPLWRAPLFYAVACSSASL